MWSLNREHDFYSTRGMVEYAMDAAEECLKMTQGLRSLESHWPRRHELISDSVWSVLRLHTAKFLVVYQDFQKLGMLGRKQDGSSGKCNSQEKVSMESQLLKLHALLVEPVLAPRVC